MTALNNLPSIAVQGLIPQNGNNGKLIGEHHFTTFQEMENKITYKALSDV